MLVERVPGPLPCKTFGTGWRSAAADAPCSGEVVIRRSCGREIPVRTRQTVVDQWLELWIGEGMNRQVRQMTAAVGHPTLRLVRCDGSYRLDGLHGGVARSAAPLRTYGSGAVGGVHVVAEYPHYADGLVGMGAVAGACRCLC